MNQPTGDGVVTYWTTVGNAEPPSSRTTVGKRVPADDPFRIATELCMDLYSPWQAVYPEAVDLPTLDEVYAFVVTNPRRRWAAS